MNKKTKIREVIVVEGKSDTEQIKKAVNADTIETRGSAISDEVLAQIDELQQKRGVIVFTDPDFNGEKIRKVITREVPGVKHAFINRQDAAPHAKGSLGVEHASAEAIRDALAHLYTEEPDTPALISLEDLQTAGLTAGPGAKRKRELLGEILRIGYTNGKQLYKRLQLFQIQPAEFAQALAQVNEMMGEQTDGE